MSKYKKIFSGLGLLSISTLIGASVVACANKKPKASDSSTEAIDQNNNQGNSTTPEQEKPGPNDEGNSSKPKEGENTPGNPAPQAPKTPGKPEDSAPEKPEKAPEQGDGSSNENSGNTNETDKKDKPNEGMNKKPEKPDKDQTPPVTLEQKATLLLAEIDKNPGYPNPKAQAIMALRNEVENIKNEAGKTEEEKLTKLKEFKTKLNKIKDALAKAVKDIDALPYPKVQLNLQKEKFAKDKFKDKLNTLTKVDEISKVLPTDWADKIKKYNEVFETIKNFINTDSLKKRFAQTDDSTSGRFTESALIWHVYETIRNKFEKEVNNSFGKEKKSEAQKFISKFSKINENGHNKNAQWLLDESKKIVSEFSKAKEEAKKSKQMV